LLNKKIEGTIANLPMAYSWCSHQPKQLNASSKMNNRNLRVFIIFSLMQ
jgi:hypothetical protein